MTRGDARYPSLEVTVEIDKVTFEGSLYLSNVEGSVSLKLDGREEDVFDLSYLSIHHAYVAGKPAPENAYLQISTSHRRVLSLFTPRYSHLLENSYKMQVNTGEEPLYEGGFSGTLEKVVEEKE
ncbi:MAG: hypothetical protein HY391_04645 [Deltaproteobacteria bacterium]|nr:hypothetical protein [Deltaproteobacteria bacterium]